MLCAMNFESDIASKRLGNRCVIRTIGVGEHCAHALKDLANEFGVGTNVILCGLAGGLNEPPNTSTLRALIQFALSMCVSFHAHENADNERARSPRS